MDRESKVTSMIEAIRARDTKLGDELQARREQRETADEARRFKPILESAVEGREEVRPQLALETIVLRTGRPVLAASHDEPQLTFSDAENSVADFRSIDWQPGMHCLRTSGSLSAAQTASR